MSDRISQIFINPANLGRKPRAPTKPNPLPPDPHRAQGRRDCILTIRPPSGIAMREGKNDLEDTLIVIKILINFPP